MKNKFLRLLILIFYIVVHSVLSTVTMSYAGIMVFVVWTFPENLFPYFYGMIAFAFLSIDTIAYYQIIKKVFAFRLFRFFVIITDLLIAAFSTIVFVSGNLYIAFVRAESWNLSDALFYTYGLAVFVVLLLSFIFIRIKLLRTHKTQVAVPCVKI